LLETTFTGRVQPTKYWTSESFGVLRNISPTASVINQLSALKLGYLDNYLKNWFTI
jgi:hypothetical protein